MSFNNVKWRVMPYSIGVEIGSDFADAPIPDGRLVEGSPRWQHENVGVWTRGEAQLLRQVGAQFPGNWLDVGAHTGWTAAQLTAAGASVTSIDPMFSARWFYRRFAENMSAELADGKVMPWAGTSHEFFRTSILADFAGCIIDGDHESPNPENDARNCFKRLSDRAVVLLHDFRGPGPWGAGEYLAKQGMQYKIYGSVHMVGVFWRGDFDPPLEIVEGSTDWTRHYGVPAWMEEFVAVPV